MFLSNNWVTLQSGPATLEIGRNLELPESGSGWLVGTPSVFRAPGPFNTAPLTLSLKQLLSLSI